jgi:hypothetical protein
VLGARAFWIESDIPGAFAMASQERALQAVLGNRSSGNTVDGDRLHREIFTLYGRRCTVLRAPAGIGLRTLIIATPASQMCASIWGSRLGLVFPISLVFNKNLESALHRPC